MNQSNSILRTVISLGLAIAVALLAITIQNQIPKPNNDQNIEASASNKVIPHFGK